MIQYATLHSDLGFAVEIRDVDLSDEVLDGSLAGELRNILFDQLVVVFREQTLSPERLVDISRWFGDVLPCLDTRYQLDNVPYIAVVGKVDEGTTHQQALFVNGKIEWHYDYAHTESPSLASLLYAIVVPPVDGDTLFVDVRSAYAALSDSDKVAIERMTARYSFDDLNELLDQQDAARLSDAAPYLATVEHPIVQIHPITGRKAILLAPDIMTPMGGLTNELLHRLVEHCTSEDFMYRHQWRKNDLVLYDNLSTIHTATPFDVDRFQRVLYRTTVASASPR